MDLQTYLDKSDVAYNHEIKMLGTVNHNAGYHSRVPEGTWVHSTRGALDYALALLRAGGRGNTERTGDIVAKIVSLQDTDPVSSTYGIWSWLYEEPLSEMAPPDWNWADFCGARLIQILIDHPDALSPALSASVRTAIGHAAWSIFRRNVKPDYTNIAIMGAGVTLAAGEILSETRLIDYGRRRLRVFKEHTDLHGSFNEYNSPTYTMVALKELERIIAIVRDPQAHADAEYLRREAWKTIADHFHPATGQWAGPHSRAYADYVGETTAAELSKRLGFVINTDPKARPETQVDLDDALRCPTDLATRFQTLPKPVVFLRSPFIKRETEEASTIGTTWLTEDACLGTINQDSMWTQRRPLIGYWTGAGSSAALLRVRFLHDGRDFSTAWITNQQIGSRVLTSISAHPSLGDFHISLDKPANGVFEAEDFRIRYELTADSAEALEKDGVYILAAGPRQAAIHVANGQFDGQPIVWKIEQTPGQATLEGICYNGPRRSFDTATLCRTIAAAGLELLRSDEKPSNAAVFITDLPNATRIEWSAAEGFQMVVPQVGT